MSGISVSSAQCRLHSSSLVKAAGNSEITFLDVKETYVWIYWGSKKPDILGTLPKTTQL